MLNFDTGSGFFELVATPLQEARPRLRALASPAASSLARPHLGAAGASLAPQVAEPHPENAARVRNMRSALRNGPLAPRVDWRTPAPAPWEAMAAVHDEAYLRMLRDASAAGKRFGVSTVLPPGGWAAISLAAGAAVEATDAALAGDAQIAYCLVRPPGHHASAGAVDGYCFVNNAAVAAARAAAAGRRVAVVDIDVHHGNGTQSIFYGRADVLTVSMHQVRRSLLHEESLKGH